MKFTYPSRSYKRRKNYELLSDWQQLSLDFDYPAHSRNVRQRILFERLFRMRMAYTRGSRILYVQKRHACLVVRKRRLRLRLQRLIPDRSPFRIRFRNCLYPSADILSGGFISKMPRFSARHFLISVCLII